jgi:hypothetical protein
MDMEKETRVLRYIFKGFELSLIQEISRNLEKNFLIKVPVISLNENYEHAIKSRANNKPIFIWIAGRRASEHSSLSSTFKCITNAFYPFKKRWERVEGIYELYDISEWLFQQDMLDYVADKFLGKGEYTAKKKVLERSFITLKTFWNVSATNPSLRNRLSPGIIAKILAGISSSHEFSFNDLVQTIGFEPSLTIPQDTTSIEAFFSYSKRLVLLLKGSYADQKTRFARLGENIIAGLLVYVKKVESRITPPKDLDHILKLCKEKDEKGRRVWIVRSSDLEIKEYSSNSGLANRILFRIRNRKTKKTCVFDDSWNKPLATSIECSLFMDFLKNENILRAIHKETFPFKLDIKKDEIDVTFNSLEGYLFGLKAFRKELDGIQI